MAEKKTNGENPSQVHVLIGNIPASYHSADLRTFFSNLIENDGFVCFHFRHRPEGQAIVDENVSASSAQNAPENETQTAPGKQRQREENVDNLPKSLNKTCCIVKMKETKFRELVQLYHKKQWLDPKDVGGKVLSSRCFISKINIKNKTVSDHQHSSETSESSVEQPSTSQSSCPDTLSTKSTGQHLSEQPDATQRLTQHDLNHLKEMQPPPLMPSGNVGTPTSVFLDLIKACKLPPKIIAKLGLKFTKGHRKRIYGSVKYEYAGKADRGSRKFRHADGKLEGSRRRSGKGNSGKKSFNVDSLKERSGKSPKVSPQSHKQNENKESESEEDVDDCEEWERHEALHDDPANYERNKERAYEEKLEVVWEKGGPGLVWYTDEKYWREQEGDFDEQTADDWDVDMSVYYEPLTGGDLDSRQLVTMRRERRRREGLYNEGDDLFSSGNIGKFEKHTKGIGRKVMEQQGWKDGSGLGAHSEGIADALDNDGQKPRDKTGFGYYGEKIRPHGTTRSSRKRRDADDFLISTVYDKPEDMEIPEKLLRRTDHNKMKYRQQHS